ncbi:uncharacterized protein LOC141911631 [Tubulanus polymorphus]|uniref:uncharacterized protein LOC141911631 n=1 Tax=Tubulanus polymorphus TaxID=672921 RepID=UPI003DA38C6B
MMQSTANVTSLRPIGRPYASYYLLDGLRFLHGSTLHVATVSMTTIFGLGLFGNAATFFIMTSRRFRHLSYAIYLTALSVTDFGSTVFLTCLPVLNYYYVKFHGSRLVDFQNRVQCILFEMLASELIICSSWFVVIIAVERFVLVFFPFTARVVCTAKFARSTLGGVLVVNALITAIIDTRTGYTDALGCHITLKHQQRAFLFFVTYVYVIPILVVIFANSAISVKLYTNRRFGGNEAKCAKTRRATVMLLAVSSVFLLTASPTTIYTFIPNIGGAAMKLIYVTLSLLLSCNYAVNFYVYLLMGREVRGYIYKRVISCNNAWTKPGRL